MQQSIYSRNRYQMQNVPTIRRGTRPQFRQKNTKGVFPTALKRVKGNKCKI